MKTASRLTIFSLCFLPLALKAAPSEVSTTQARMTSINLANRLLTSATATETPDEIARSNPFVPKREPEPEAPSAKAPASAPASDREILAGIAAGFMPSGTMSIGDTTLLLVGQKRLKVGDVISIVFQGLPYQVQVTGVERTSYTLRLNKEEISRPIKSSK